MSIPILFETRDLVLATYLVCIGHILDHVTPGPNGKGVFHITNVPPEDISTYDRGQGRVDPILFHNTLRRLVTSSRRLRGDE